MIKNLLLIFLFGCGTEVSISKTYKKDPDTSVEIDTSVSNIDTSVNTVETDTQDTQDSNDTQSNSDLSNVVGFVETGLIQAACPYCLGLPQEINTRLKVRLHNPTTSSHNSWIPLPNQGCRDYYETNVSSQNLDVGNSVQLQNDFGDNLALQKNFDQTGVVYENTYLSDANFRRNSNYSLNVNGKIADNVTRSLRGFDFIEPYTMLYVDPSYAFQAPISRNGNNVFTWGPSGDTNSTFSIHISVYSYDGSVYYGTVICGSDDSGYMSIPGSYFLQYQPGSLTSIHLMRHRTSTNAYEDFEGTIEGYSWWEVIGTGFIQ